MAHHTYGTRRLFVSRFLRLLLYILAIYIVVLWRQSCRVRHLDDLAKMGLRSTSQGMVDSIVSMGNVSVNQVKSISKYDNIFMDLSDLYGTDWRLMSAIGYHESHFREGVRSYSGAVGIMQIMPRTGRVYGVEDVALLADPAVNIRVANLHYVDIERMLRLPEAVSDENRMSLVLASYNGGVGRVMDAQRLARSEDQNPYLWSVVANYLVLLREEEYYTRSVVRSGRFGTAYHTVRYVKDVMGRYRKYCKLTPQHPHRTLPLR